MDRQQLEIFRNHTQAIYREQGATVGHDKFDDSKLSKSYLKNFVNFLRRRKHPQ